MKFQDLLKKYNYNNIKPVILNLYPSEKIWINKGYYETLYNTLLALNIIEHELNIVINQTTDSLNTRTINYAIGIESTTGTRYEFEFAQFEHILGYNVLLNGYDEKEFIVHVLYEITYLGFDQLTIKNKLPDIYISKNVGTVVSGQIQYENDDWCNITNGIVQFNLKDNQDVTGNWTIKLYIKNLINDKVFLQLYDNDMKKLELKYFEDKIYLKDMQNGYTIWQDIIVSSNEDIFVIWLQNNDGYMNLKIEKI